MPHCRRLGEKYKLGRRDIQNTTNHSLGPMFLFEGSLSLDKLKETWDFVQ